MTDTPAPTNPDNPRLDDARRRAIDAAMKVFERNLKLYAPHRHLVVEALDAASDVMTDFELDEADRQMREAGFAGMDVIGAHATIRLKHATDFARLMVLNFDELIRQRGCENYTETEFTVTDPATEQAAAAGLPPQQWPPHRRYSFIVVKPGGKTPHQLRQEADARVAELEQQLRTVQEDTRRALCQEICDLAGSMPALKALVVDSGGDTGEMSLSRARALLRTLASLGGVLDDELPEEPPSTPAARRRAEDVAGRRFDMHNRPALVSAGVPPEQIEEIREKVIQGVMADHAAMTDPQRREKALRELGLSPADVREVMAKYDQESGPQ